MPALPSTPSASVRRRLPFVGALCAALTFAGCGGGGGGGGGPTPQPDLSPPSLTLTSFQNDLVIAQAGSVTISWIADDQDDEATVSIFLDVDGDLGTDADRTTVVDEVVDQNGAEQAVTVDLRDLPSGSYAVVGRILDGKGAERVATAAGRLRIENRAMVAPLGDSNEIEFRSHLPRPDGSFDVLGRFRGIVEFDARRRVQSTSRNWDLFVAHYSARGIIQWLSVFPSTGDLEAGDFVRAANGDLIAVGSFGGTLTLPNGSTTRGRGFDVFIARVSAAGEQLWVRAAASGNRDVARDIELLSDGSFVVTGPFNIGNTTIGMDFGNDRNGQPVSLMSRGDADAFVARYEPNGTPIWARSVGGTLNEEASTVTVLPGDRIVVGGSFQGTVQFDAAGAETRTVVGGADAFVAEWDVDGGLQRVDTFTGPGDESVATLAASAAGALLVLANSESTELDVAGQATLQLAADSDATLSSFATDGTLQWSIGEAVGAGACVGTDLHPLPDGSLLVAGTYSDGARIGGGTTLPAAGPADGFVSMRGADGSLTWVHRFSSSASASAMALSSGADGTLLVTGDRGAADLEITTGRGSVLLPASGSADFVARFHADGELGREADPSRRVAAPATITRGRLRLRIEGLTAYLNGMQDGENTPGFQQLVDEHPLVGLLVFERANGPDFGHGHIPACRLIAAAGIETHIAFNGSMYGGGIDLFLGGRRRTVEDGAIVGARSWMDTDRSTGFQFRNQRMNAVHTRYLELYDALGVTQDYYWFYLRTERTTFLPMNRNQLVRFEIVTD